MSALAVLLLLALTILSGLKVYYSDTSVEAIPYILAAGGRLLAMLIGSLSLAIGIHLVLFLQYSLIPTPDQHTMFSKFPLGTSTAQENPTVLVDTKLYVLTSGEKFKLNEVVS